jgi:formylglycine-generating enzyme required for sulfatase activity
VPGGLVPVASTAFRHGDSKDGVEQLIGNAQEWTATVVRDNAKRALVSQETWNERDRVPGLLTMGGGYMNEVDSAENLFFPADPSAPDRDIGFRCVMTAK